ncbi:MAG TPA: bifunctional [glutamine synthetase] adenylyltransferase/[glutamine synthetase]-adenylyl-L-tyrosine phosphorylase, partial [Afipia sp.]
MSLPATGDAQGISLAARFSTGPQLFAPDEARRRLADWLSELPSYQARALQDIAANHPQAGVILEGIAEFSPFLFDLMRADAARVIALLESDPDAHLSALIARTVRDTAANADEADIMRFLRRMKSEAALLIALCDIGGVWPVMRVTRALTDIAEASVQCAVRYLLAQEVSRGRLLAPVPAKPEQGSGLIVFAMGKMGAGELNYSSDIDLIVYYDRERPKLAADVEPSPFFVRIAQGLSRILQQRTADGYVFRVDLRLRPDPASTPVAISTAA